ncbi:MAG: tyrosine-type recombinase/integrase [Pseudonocardiaceae bacterium]
MERYRGYLLVERGLVVKASRGYVDLVRPFIAGRVSADGVGLEALTAGEVSAFLVAQSRRLAPKTTQRLATALRSLLRFWHVEGLISRPLAQSVPKVAGLRLDDIDWRRGEITIRGKGSRCDRLPLPVDVGHTVAGYLRHGRPATALERGVFIRVKAPHRGLTSTGVTQVVAAAARRVGLGTIYAHRLRHSAATSMLAHGASLTEIGQVPRHRRALTTAVYAMVDTEAWHAQAGCVMTELRGALADYLDLRRSLGFSLARDAKLWCRDGGDVAARMPLLSTYLGHVEPANTYWYPQAAPELMAEAARRLDTAPGDRR